MHLMLKTTWFCPSRLVLLYLRKAMDFVAQQAKVEEGHFIPVPVTVLQVSAEIPQNTLER